MSKQKITQVEADRIVSRAYNSGKFQYADDIQLWMSKKFEVVK